VARTYARGERGEVGCALALKSPVTPLHPPPPPYSKTPPIFFSPLVGEGVGGVVLTFLCTSVPNLVKKHPHNKAPHSHNFRARTYVYGRGGEGGGVTTNYSVRKSINCKSPKVHFDILPKRAETLKMDSTHVLPKHQKPRTSNKSSNILFSSVRNCLRPGCTSKAPQLAYRNPLVTPSS
jgi:hypothetical protein